MQRSRDVAEDDWDDDDGYISNEDTVPARKPWWIILGVILALYAVYRWIAG